MQRKETSFLICRAGLPILDQFQPRIIYNWDMNDGPPSRIGTFFILVGLILLLIFIASIAGQGENKAKYLLLSVAALSLGFLLNRRSSSSAPSARFSGMRQLREQDKKRREEREQKKQERKKK
jgi:hypothetical protein